MLNFGGEFRHRVPSVHRSVRILLISVALFSASGCTHVPLDWESPSVAGAPTARHEAALVAHKDKLYLIGGRRINPVDVFDPASGQWVERSTPPIELHHFQAVSFDDAIYIIGAMTGEYPNETPLERVVVYYPGEDRFEFGHSIPEARRRGAAGAVAYNQKIYIVGGITHGHTSGFQPWLDEYDPQTGEWRVLPDAPNARDHFQAVVVRDKLYAFAGRRSSQATGQTIDLTVSHGNVFDFTTQRWEPVTSDLEIPTPRAGNMAIAWNDLIIVAGGESSSQVPAHDEVEVYDTVSATWQDWPRLNTGRHGSGLAIINNRLFTAAGSGNRGGEPELTTLERLNLPEAAPPRDTAARNGTKVYMQWHTVTLPFEGPMTSELSSNNVFTDYRLLVTFEHEQTSYTVRGFYAADGEAAESGANSGNVWKVRFTPDRVGPWSFRAELRKGADIAIDDDPKRGELVKTDVSRGRFIVIPSDKVGRDFRAHGRLVANKGYFQFRDSTKHWLKGGANSPENFLAFADFDDTYQAVEKVRDGEAVRESGIHKYSPHVRDWVDGDPSWRNGKGKGIVGAVNYLSSTGMNAAYFLTMNIGGDGDDVWPYTSYEERLRFDCSKLAQWGIVFEHMQSKGILLHLVTQETENERMLDGGDTGRLRQLYYRELIARFGHHLALVWNLGEENGPADFSPNGQNNEQRKSMAAYFQRHDPYNHPVLLHTHADVESKNEILSPLLGFYALDGLSFQVDDRERVNAEIAEWRRLASNADHDWLVTMDEVGMWHTGALPDSLDSNHDSLRRHALWGSLLGGAAGIEWYFGAKYPGNDLTSEDWRDREKLWHLTRNALDFFEHLQYWEMQSCNDRTLAGHSYCFGKPGEAFALYTYDTDNWQIDIGPGSTTYTIGWYDPLTGGLLQSGSEPIVTGTGLQALGEPPHSPGQDWAILLQRQ